jgi:hypothetical protein
LTPEEDKQLSTLLHTFMRLNHKHNRIVDQNGYPQTLSNFAVEAHCSDVPFSLPITVGNEVDFRLRQTCSLSGTTLRGFDGGRAAPITRLSSKP